MVAHAIDRLRPYALPLVVLLITWGIIAGITPSFRGVGSIFAVLEGFPLVGLAASGSRSRSSPASWTSPSARWRPLRRWSRS